MNVCLQHGRTSAVSRNSLSDVTRHRYVAQAVRLRALQLAVCSTDRVGTGNRYPRLAGKLSV